MRCQDPPPTPLSAEVAVWVRVQAAVAQRAVVVARARVAAQAAAVPVGLPEAAVRVLVGLPEAAALLGIALPLASNACRLCRRDGWGR